MTRRLTLTLLAIGAGYALLLWLCAHVGPVLTTSDRLTGLLAFTALFGGLAHLIALLAPRTEADRETQ